MAPNPKDFFNQRRSAAEIKAEVLPKFFLKWGEAVLTELPEEQTTSLLYVDLMASAGLPLEDPKKAAALQVLKSSYLSSGSRQDLNKRLQAFFFDAAKGTLPALEEQVQALSFYQELENKPNYLHHPENLPEFYQQMEGSVPALFFLDPFGNRFSQDVWSKSLERNNTDIIFLLDPKRLKQAVKNAKEDQTSNLFGGRLTALQQILQQTSQASRKEEAVVQALVEALEGKGYSTTKFRINIPGKDTTDFYLMLVSKSALLHTRFKELLLQYSDYQEDGVPQMGVNLKPLRLLVPEYHRFLKYSMVNLVEELARKSLEFNSMMLEKIYEKHNIGTHYCRDNYFRAFEQLKEQGKVRFMNPKTGQVVSKLTYGSRVKFLIE